MPSDVDDISYRRSVAEAPPLYRGTPISIRIGGWCSSWISSRRSAVGGSGVRAYLVLVAGGECMLWREEDSTTESTTAHICKLSRRLVLGT